MILAGTWVFLLIAIPGLINTWLNYKFPATNKLELADYRDHDYKAWDKPLVEHKKIVAAKFPTINLERENLDSGDIKSFGYTIQVTDKEKEIYNNQLKQKLQQTKAEENTFWINPIGGIMRSFTTLSKSSLQHQQAFEQATIDVRERKGNHLFVNLLTQPHFTKKDYANMPKYQSLEISHSITKYLLPLFLIIAIGFILTFIINKKSITIQ
jgi:hypothetical protein